MAHKICHRCLRDVDPVGHFQVEDEEEEEDWEGVVLLHVDDAKGSGGLTDQTKKQPSFCTLPFYLRLHRGLKMSLYLLRQSRKSLNEISSCSSAKIVSPIDR